MVTNYAQSAHFPTVLKGTEKQTRQKHFSGKVAPNLAGVIFQEVFAFHTETHITVGQKSRESFCLLKFEGDSMGPLTCRGAKKEPDKVPSLVFSSFLNLNRVTADYSRSVSTRCNNVRYVSDE